MNKITLRVIIINALIFCAAFFFMFYTKSYNMKGFSLFAILVNPLIWPVLQGVTNFIIACALFLICLFSRKSKPRLIQVAQGCLLTALVVGLLAFSVCFGIYDFKAL